jgi:predicted porin
MTSRAPSTLPAASAARRGRPSRADKTGSASRGQRRTAYYRTDSLSDGLEGRRELVIIGASYYFSKRTLVYRGVYKNRYEGALVPASRQTCQFGAASGIQHTF